MLEDENEFFDQMLQHEEEIDKMLMNDENDFDLLQQSLDPDKIERHVSEKPFSMAEEL